ncbi:MAG: sensor histidine kinase, partial [Phycisphaerae bacterium]
RRCSCKMRCASSRPVPAGCTAEPGALAPADPRRVLAGESLSYEVHLSQRTYHCHVEPLRSADGAIAGCIGVALDITEHKRLEEQHARVREQLHQAHKMDMIGRLAAGLSHDFGNVLATVAGYTALARRHLPEDHPAHRSLDAIDEAAQQARGMTHALLSFGGRVRVAKRPLNLRAAVEASVRLLRHALPASVELSVSLPEPPLWIEADPVQVQQVLLNLALNARDAMPGGGRLEISLGPASEAQAREVKSRPGVSPAAACLAVRDTGEGMSAEILPHVFEPFFTTKKRDRGTGLGLSIVHGIVTDLGGRIRVASAPGEGTTFTLVLPCVAPSPATGADEPSAMRREGLIALVGGDRHIRGVMAATLSPLGYDVVQADDPGALLADRDVCRDRLRLVVFPAEMLKNGNEWFGRLRGPKGSLPAVSVADETDPVAEGVLPEGVRVLRRPFQMAEFRDLVCRLLDR